MFKVNGIPILADEMTIISVLKTQLAEQGLYYFDKYRIRNNELQVCCPFHKNGQERKPSATISLQDQKNFDGKIIKAGTFHCFACGTTCDITQVISHCSQKEDFGQYGKEWLTSNFIQAVEETDTSLAPLGGANKALNQTYISPEELDKYRFIHDYMYERGLTDELIEMFDVGYDANFKLKSSSGKESIIPSLTFPVRDINGNTLFIARRSVKGKIFYLPPDIMKPIYGIYELYKYCNIGVDENLKLHVLDELYVVESIFNCITCWKYGVPAIALLGTGTPHQHKQIERLPVNKIILGLDPDEAGDKGIERFLRNVHMTNIQIMDIPEGKDINDLSEDEFNAVERFSAKSCNLLLDY